jgi:hypothetical protein
MLAVLNDEVKTCMRLLGVQRVEQLGLQHVSTFFLIPGVYTDWFHRSTLA